MKRILFLFIIALTTFLLTGCSDPIVSETGYDLQGLDECIDAMVDADSNQACDETTKETLYLDYINSFMEEYSNENMEVSHTNLTYSQGRGDVSGKIEFWFQFRVLSETSNGSQYEAFRDLIMAMSTELHQMNDQITYQFNGEFFMENDIIYKFHHFTDEVLKSDVILYGMESTFELTYEANETLILEKAQDGDMLEVVITLVTGNHNVAITCQPSTQTYSTNVYRTDDQSASTALEIETLIDGSFSTISFTNSN